MSCVNRINDPKKNSKFMCVWCSVGMAVNFLLHHFLFSSNSSSNWKINCERQEVE